VIQVEPQHLSDAWAKVEPWIAQSVAVNQGDENVTDVLIALARGQYALWHEPGKFAAVSRIERWPRQTVGTIVYLGGKDLQAIEDAFEEAKMFAKANKIDVIRVFGRVGWERLLGMKRKGVILQLEVA
jgi:hypothetical protein